MNTVIDPSKRTAIQQDTINGLNDPMPWPVQWWATQGDTLWTACRARGEGVDALGIAYEPGDLIVHQHTIDGDHTKITKGFGVIPRRLRNPLKEMLKSIGDWNNGLEPERYGTVREPGMERLTVPETGRELRMGWSEAIALAGTAMQRNDQQLMGASLLQNSLDHTVKPCVWFLEANGYDLIVAEWHRDAAGRFDRCDFRHLQYDDIAMDVATIAHSRAPYRITPQQLDADGLVEQSRIIRDTYQQTREQDGGSVAAGMFTGNAARCGVAFEGDPAKPLLELPDGRNAPEWDGLIDVTANLILTGRSPVPLPALPQVPPQTQTQQPTKTVRQAAETNILVGKMQEVTTPAVQLPDGSEPDRRDPWPNMWISNRRIHPYTLHARDGRDWNKMIVTLPQGTIINGRDMGGWCVDRFMSQSNMRQKDAGRGVNVRFQPGVPVELFRGRGEHRQTATVDDPSTLAHAVAESKRIRAAHTPEPSADDAGERLATIALDNSWPKISRLEDRLADYMQRNEYREDAALRGARRIIDAAAVLHERDNGNPACRNAGESPFSPAQRQDAARRLLTGILDDIRSKNVAHEPRTATVPDQDGENRTDGDADPDRNRDGNRMPRRRHQAR